MNTKEQGKRNGLFGAYANIKAGSGSAVARGPLIGQFARLLPVRQGLRYKGENLVFPLDMRHPIQQPLELVGRDGRTEPGDSSRDLATRGRDCL